MDKHISIVIQSIKNTLIGLAQIMLQPSVGVGMVFLVGSAINSVPLAILGLIGSAAGTLTAVIFGFSPKDIRNGLFGFNGALVGFGLGYFYSPILSLVIFVLLGASASTIIMQYMRLKGWQPFTFPFVITTWLIMLLFTATGSFEIIPWSLGKGDRLNFMQAVFRGTGQVFFQEYAVTGLFLVTAITLNNWVAGIFTIGASCIGMLVALSFGLPTDAINLGLFGYNGVLCAIAFAGKSLRDIITALVAILLSFLIYCGVIYIGIPALTFPFVLAAWITFWGRGWLDKKLSMR